MHFDGGGGETFLGLATLGGHRSTRTSAYDGKNLFAYYNSRGPLGGFYGKHD